MSFKMQTLILLLILTISSFTVKASASDAGIAVYWGQNIGDGSLESTCDTGNFKIVLLAFLNSFGDGRFNRLNFTGHCGDRRPCSDLKQDILHCQQRGVKVFLSIGGAPGDYSLGSPDDAKRFSYYLKDNFLSGKFGPLGPVYLDGINFHIEAGSDLYWDDLARYLDDGREDRYKYFYLSAAPGCHRPDNYLDKAINTGLFDYLFVKFYNSPECQFDRERSDASLLLESWKKWTSSVRPNNTVFLGLPAAPRAAPRGGYIPRDDLVSKVLPSIKHTSNYGGVMLWDRYHDNGNNNYSDQIKWDVLKSALQFVKQVSEAIAGSVSAALNAVLHN